MTPKHFGSILLAAGFLAGAYVTVARVDSIDWTQYAVCAGLMLGGLVLVRTGGADGEAEHAVHDENLSVLDQALERLIGRVGGFAAIDADRELLGLHRRIDDELMEDLGTFVDARESMIPRLGMQTYANVMSPFATAERLLNRAWSASADGYVDEVRTCVRDALAELEQSRAVLSAARS